MIYDITPLIHENLAVFPGDTPFSRKILKDYTKGDNYALSSVSHTLHLGAHADAPYHYAEKGESIEECDLKDYLGPCLVYQVLNIGSNKKGEIRLGDLNKKRFLEVFKKNNLSKNQEKKIDKVLIRTDSYSPDSWNGHFFSFSEEVIKFFYELGVKTVGIDTPSVDQATSHDLPVHHQIFFCGMRILEGLDLRKVEEGKYFLVALPLKIKNAEASPVRAILSTYPLNSF